MGVLSSALSSPLLRKKTVETHQQDRLPGHPAYRQQRLALGSVVVGAEDAATDAEVGYFDGVLVTDETVPCRQVAMYDVQCLQVLHTRRYLSRHVDQTTVTVHNTQTDTTL